MVLDGRKSEENVSGVSAFLFNCSHRFLDALPRLAMLFQHLSIAFMASRNTMNGSVHFTMLAH
jgi:hypothetical protein